MSDGGFEPNTYYNKEKRIYEEWLKTVIFLFFKYRTSLENSIKMPCHISKYDTKYDTKIPRGRTLRGHLDRRPEGHGGTFLPYPFLRWYSGELMNPRYTSSCDFPAAS